MLSKAVRLCMAGDPEKSGRDRFSCIQRLFGGFAIFDGLFKRPNSKITPCGGPKGKDSVQLRDTFNKKPPRRQGLFLYLQLRFFCGLKLVQVINRGKSFNELFRGYQFACGLSVFLKKCRGRKSGFKEFFGC